METSLKYLRSTELRKPGTMASNVQSWLKLPWLLGTAVLVSCSPSEPSPPQSSSPTHYGVSGTVRDEGNLNALAGVAVRLTADAGAREVVTAFEGQFSFAEVSGNATLTVTAAGYQASTLTASSTTVDAGCASSSGGRAFGCLWGQHPSGARSIWLWCPGEAPRLR